MSESVALQDSIYDALIADAAVSAIVGTKVYDKPPATAEAPYISVGPSDFAPADADGIRGRYETLQLDCWADSPDARREVKNLVDAVKKALHKQKGTIDPGAIGSLEVTFARVIDDPDGITLHGVVIVQAFVEEV